MQILALRRLDTEELHDRQELKIFRTIARRNRMIGEWAAGQMGMTPTEADGYATAITALGLKPGGESAIIDRVIADFDAHDVPVPPDFVLAEMSRMLLAAENQRVDEEPAADVPWVEAA